MKHSVKTAQVLAIVLSLGALAPSARGGLVNLELRPISTLANVGDVVELGLYAVSDNAGDEPVGIIIASFVWDPIVLRFDGLTNDSPYAWLASLLPDDSTEGGINNTFSDGNALYRAVAQTSPLAQATPSGLLVVTLRFTAISASLSTSVQIVSTLLGTDTVVLDSPLPGFADVTGTLGSASLTVQCQANGDCDDGNPCTDDSCVSNACNHVPNDLNDPDDGLFCNGTEDRCENGTVVFFDPPPDCSDGLACTDDVCDEDVDACINPVIVGACLIAGVCFTDDATNPVNDCEYCDSIAFETNWSSRLLGTTCGDETESDCDHADTCDGFGACEENIEFAGVLCGDGADNACTAPDTCDGLGFCKPNHAADETPCDDLLFCTAVDLCADGVCLGSGDTCPGQACDEFVDECKSVDLEWRPVVQIAQVDDVVNVQLVAVSPDGVNQSFATLSAIILWDPLQVEFLGKVDDGPYAWLSSSFPNDTALDGLNDSFTDGDALYQALGQISPSAPAEADAAGLLVTSFQFRVLSDGPTLIELGVSFGVFTETKVLDSETPGLDITGMFGPPALIDVVECLVDVDCIDTEFCNGAERCIDNSCQPGDDPCPGESCEESTDSCVECLADSECNDGVFCNGIELCDESNQCQSPGDPCPVVDSCDESNDICTVCIEPGVEAEGSRYIAITPPAFPTPVALRVHGDPGDPSVACVSLYVQADGTLGGKPVFQSPEQWGTVHARSNAIIPDTNYTVSMDCGNGVLPIFSDDVPTRTWLWGDVNNSGPPVDFSDIQGVVKVFQNDFSALSLQNTDLDPCTPNQVIDFFDIGRVVDAFQGGVFSCAAVCNPPDNDDCVDTVAIGEGALFVDTFGALTDGPAEPFACAFSVNDQIDADVWYCYTPSCTGTATISLCGSDFDTRLAVYDGCVCPNSASAAACDDDTCGSQSEVSLSVEACSSYLIRVGGFDSDQGNATLTVSCTADPVVDDCNTNGIDDSVELACGLVPDCNGNLRPDSCDVADVSDDCQPNGIPDECEPDCNGNGTADTCDIADGFADDCNINSIPDSCDIDGGGSFDSNGNGIPDECECIVLDAPIAVTQGTCSINADCNPLAEQGQAVCRDDGCYSPRNRYLVFDSPPAPFPGASMAFRISITAMPERFAAFVGVELWVGPPDDNGVSRLQDSIELRDWGVATILVADCNIVPGGEYAMEAIAGGCPEADANSYSLALALPTSRKWGDLVGPFDVELGGFTPPDGLVDFVDISAVVARFQNVAGAPPVSFADLAGNSPQFVIDFRDVSAAVAGFKNLPYRFDGPSPSGPCTDQP